MIMGTVRTTDRTVSAAAPASTARRLSMVGKACGRSIEKNTITSRKAIRTPYRWKKDPTDGGTRRRVRPAGGGASPVATARASAFAVVGMVGWVSALLMVSSELEAFGLPLLEVVRPDVGPLEVAVGDVLRRQQRHRERVHVAAQRVDLLLVDEVGEQRVGGHPAAPLRRGVRERPGRPALAQRLVGVGVAVH